MKQPKPEETEQGRPALALHTVEFVAEGLHYHPESLRRAIRAGRIEAVKVGKSWRIPSAVYNRIMTLGLPA